MKYLKVRLTQIDGKDPNLAIMQLSSYYKSIGAAIYFRPSINRDIFEPIYDYVFASAIFSTSTKKVKSFLHSFPKAIIGGSWTFQNDEVSEIKQKFPLATILEITETVESFLGLPDNSYPFYDYSIYPNCNYAIGFTQRGCRLRCKFCVVPKKEGKNKSLNFDIKFLLQQNPNANNRLMLNDNDFTNQPLFEERCQELIALKTLVCIQQGINVRLIDFKNRKVTSQTTNSINKSQAELLSQINYRCRQFKNKRIYTAWDNAKDEKNFWEGINILVSNGFKPQNIRVYFLCNFWNKSLSNDVWYRFKKMVDFGLDPYVMIYEKWTLPANDILKIFKTWVNGHFYSKENVSKDELMSFKNHYLNRKLKTKPLKKNTLFQI